MIDSLPEGATLVSVTPGAPTCTVANGQITCNLGTVPAFGSVTIHVQIMAPPVCPNTIINHATVLGSGVDPDPQNNVSKVTTVIECGGPTNVTLSSLDGGSTPGPVSAWPIVALALATLAAATVILRRRTAR